MKTPLTAFLAAALFLAGCATQPKEQIAAVRAAGVSPELLHKLEHGGRLSPEDLIELRHRHVNDGVALRQLDRAGVDYVVDKDVVRRLRKAGVSETVVTAAVNAGKNFEDQYRHPYVSAWVGPYGYPYGYYPYGYPYDPFYYGYVSPYPSYHHHANRGIDYLPGPHRWIH